MALIEIDSRNKIAIEWYDDEAEAEARVESAQEQGRARAAEGYDFGYLSIGRDRGFDKEKDGVKLFAVVTP